MQQMHQGQLSGPPNPAGQQNALQPAVPLATAPGAEANPSAALSANASSLDDLVSGAAKDADKASVAVEAKPEAPNVEKPKEEKKGKKDKDKATKLMYSDNEVSPEEKMAKMPRYAFAPSG